MLLTVCFVFQSIHRAVRGRLLLFGLALLGSRAAAQAPSEAADSLATRPSPPRLTIFDCGAGRGTYRYDRPRLFAPLLDSPADAWAWVRYSAHARSLPALGVVAASTAILLPLDQALVDGAYRLATHVGLDHSSDQEPIVAKKMGALNLAIRFPTTLNSTLYWLGEGAPSLLVAGGFWATGLVRRDNRALATAAQLCENALVTGLVTQGVKRSTGRESPRVSTRRGGRWDFFPDPFLYQRHVPSYDAFPSGHLCTLTSTVTTIAENYPEYRWIYPVGGVVVGTVALVMMNTGVHWASDYPLAIALGYSYARLAARRHRTRLDLPALGARRRWPRPQLVPTGLGLALSWTGF